MAVVFEEKKYLHIYTYYIMAEKKEKERYYLPSTMI